MRKREEEKRGREMRRSCRERRGEGKGRRWRWRRKWGEFDQSFASQAGEGEVGGTKTGNKGVMMGDRRVMSLTSLSGSGGGGANRRDSGL